MSWAVVSALGGGGTRGAPPASPGGMASELSLAFGLFDTGGVADLRETPPETRLEVVAEADADVVAAVVGGGGLIARRYANACMAAYCLDACEEA